MLTLPDRSLKEIMKKEGVFRQSDGAAYAQWRCFPHFCFYCYDR